MAGWRAPESTEPLRAVPLTSLPGVARYPSFSPDGNHVAFTWNGPKQDNPDIYVQQIGAGTPLRLTTDPRNDHSPVWSPDGRSIAFLRRQPEADKSELRLVPPLGGPEHKLAEIRVRETYVIPPYLAWCPDSNGLVVTDLQSEGKPDALFVVSLETGEKRQLTNPQPPVLGDSNPAVSRDGHSLVFRRTVGAGASDLYWLPLGKGVTARGEPRRLTLAALVQNHQRGRLRVVAATMRRPGELNRADFADLGALTDLFWTILGLSLRQRAAGFKELTRQPRLRQSSPSPPREWTPSPSFPPTDGGSSLHRIAREKWKSGWPIPTGPTPSSSPPWALKSPAPHAGLLTVR